MRILVTRPLPQADEWVQKLRASGVQAEALPLIELVPPEDPAGVAQAWAGLPSQDLAVFVSPNAASFFFAGRPSGAAWPQAVQAASPGPGTKRVLHEFGVQAIVTPPDDSPQFDSEALWPLLAMRDWHGRRALLVRSTGGRDWLAERLREGGALLSHVTAYRRLRPRLGVASQALLDEALVRPQDHLWLFSSSESIDHLDALAPQAHWRQARAIATHPRIAARARSLGMQQVHEARPTLDAVVACIQSIAS